jgi:hypothetical protein
MPALLRPALVLGMALALVCGGAGPAGAKQRARERSSVFGYEIRQANIDELVSFHSDLAACAPAGLCGYAGTVRYAFHGRGFGAFESPGRRSSLPPIVFGSADGTGRTVSDVALAGSTTHCTDVLPIDSDGFEGLFRGRRVTVTLHAAAGQDQTTISTLLDMDYLDTHCPGPRDRDLIASGATPSRSYSISRFRRRRFAIVFADTRPFRAGGFIGTVRFRVTFGLIRRFHQPLAESGPVP